MNIWFENMQLIKSIIENNGLEINSLFIPLKVEELSEISFLLRKILSESEHKENQLTLNYIGINTKYGSFYGHNYKYSCLCGLYIDNFALQGNNYSGRIVEFVIINNEISTKSVNLIHRDSIQKLINGQIYETHITYDDFDTFNSNIFVLPINIFINEVSKSESLFSLLLKYV